LTNNFISLFSSSSSSGINWLKESPKSVKEEERQPLPLENRVATMLRLKQSTRLLAALAAVCCLLGAVSAVDIPSNVDFSNKDLPETGELMHEIFSVLGNSLAESHEVTEDEVKRHLLRRRGFPTVGSLLGLGSGQLAGINYTDLYERFTDQYCSEAQGTRPDPPSLDIEDVLYTTTSYTGPTLGIQISMGSCTEIGNKTFRCSRPQIVIVKSPATIEKDGPAVGASKPGGEFVDKECAWSESKDIGHGESAELYNGGSETYDYSGYRAALYGRVGSRFGGIGQRLQGVAARARAARQNFKMPRLGNMFRRRMNEEFDIHNLDRKTHDRLAKVLPGFLK
jgi:hypothetical protein